MLRVEAAMGKRLDAQQKAFDRKLEEQAKDFEAKQRRQEQDFQRRLNSMVSSGGRRRSRSRGRDISSGSGSGGGGSSSGAGKGSPQVCFDWLLNKCEWPCKENRVHTVTESALEQIQKNFPKFKSVKFSDLVCVPVPA
jgi:hypothetical protein